MFEANDDIVLPFQLESSLLRGKLVRLGSALDEILRQHAYPDSVAELLAQTTAVAAALGSSLKYDGVFTVQAKGDGPVRMLVTDVASDGAMRACAQFDKDRLGGAPADAALLGNGFMGFTCASPDTADRYQGIVKLEGLSLAEAVQHYFRQSEQLPTGILTAASRDEENRWRAGCLLLQRLPSAGGFDVESSTPEAEDWTRAMTLMGTCTPHELTDPTLPAEELLFRLFHEEGVRVYDPSPLRAQCRCSEARVRSMIGALPRAEIEAMAAKAPALVTCDFCSRTYSIGKDDLLALCVASAKKND